VDQALEEFARYQPIGRFRFEDNSLRRLRTGGEFQATNLRDFLDSLLPTYGIRYTLTQGADGQMTVNLSRKQTDVRRRGS
jgi:ferric-dicitrate binding protein FerR (iron transport regulator)